MGEYVHGDFGTVTMLINKSKNVLKTGPLMHAFRRIQKVCEGLAHALGMYL